MPLNNIYINLEVMRMIGYSRVSSKEQKLERQIEALCNLGMKKEKIHFDKQSVKDFNRTAYKELLKVAKKDDIIIIKSIDKYSMNIYI